MNRVSVTDAPVGQVRQLRVDLFEPVVECVGIGHARGPLPMFPGGHPTLLESRLRQSPEDAGLVHASSFAGVSSSQDAYPRRTRQSAVSKSRRLSA